MSMPLCAKCQRPVAWLERTRDPMTDDLRFEAFCHGEAETAILHREEIYSLTGMPDLPVFFALPQEQLPVLGACGGHE